MIPKEHERCLSRLKPYDEPRDAEGQTHHLPFILNEVQFLTFDQTDQGSLGQATDCRSWCIPDY